MDSSGGSLDRILAPELATRHQSSLTTYCNLLLDIKGPPNYVVHSWVTFISVENLSGPDEFKPKKIISIFFVHCIRFWLMTILISPFYRTCFLKVMNALKPLYCLTQFLRRSSIKHHLLRCYFWIFPKQTVEFFHIVSHHILLQVAKAAGLPLSIANYLQHLYEDSSVQLEDVLKWG